MRRNKTKYTYDYNVYCINGEFFVRQFVADSNDSCGLLNDGDGVDSLEEARTLLPLDKISDGKNFSDTFVEAWKSNQDMQVYVSKKLTNV